MRIRIEHLTRFLYTGPVLCEPLTIRLRPREDHRQRLLRFQLVVDPEPAGLSDVLDHEGNAVARAWFEGRTDELLIATRAVVETQLTNPFRLLLAPHATRLPLSLQDDERAVLAPYAQREDESPLVSEFVQESLHESDREPLEFLTRLCSRIQSHCKLIVREQGAPWPAARTLEDRRGACRDLAVLFNEACRAVGLPARFVSGYQIDVPDGARPELHAWSEVYLPGAGWRGFDPSQGLAVTDRHVPLAAGRTPYAAAPTSGTYLGAGIDVRVLAKITLQAGD